MAKSRNTQLGPKKIDDGAEEDESLGRVYRTQGLQGDVARAIRREDADARYGREPAARKPFRKGGKVKVTARKRK